MEPLTSLIGTLLEKSEHYAKTSAELYKLKAIDKSADVISTLTARLAVLAVVTLFFLILNIGTALWLGEIIGNTYSGFFIVAGFDALAGIVIYVFRKKWIESPLRSLIISRALK